MQMPIELTYNIICLFYRGVLREIIYKTVIDTETDWDNKLLELTDELFKYKKG